MGQEDIDCSGTRGSEIQKDESQHRGTRVQHSERAAVGGMEEGSKNMGGGGRGKLEQTGGTSVFSESLLFAWHIVRHCRSYDMFFKGCAWP